MRYLFSLLLSQFPFLLLGQTDCDSLFKIADSLRDEKKLNEAITACTKIIDINCKNLQRALNNRGSLYVDIRNYDLALVDLNKAVELDSTNASTIANIGVVYSSMERYDEAFNYLDKAIKLSPDYDLFYQLRADTKANDSDFAGAITDYRKCILLNKHNVRAYENLIRIYELFDNIKDAEDTYDSVIVNNPDHSGFIMERGYFYYRNGEFDRAIIDYTTFLSIDPDNYEALANRGICYYYKGESDKALDDYTQSIKIKENYLAYYNRALLYKRVFGNYKKAIKDNLKCIELNPDYATAYLNLGNCYIETKEPDKAKIMFEKGLTKDPDPKTKGLLELRLSQFH